MLASDGSFVLHRTWCVSLAGATCGRQSAGPEFTARRAEQRASARAVGARTRFIGSLGGIEIALSNETTHQRRTFLQIHSAETSSDCQTKNSQCKLRTLHFGWRWSVSARGVQARHAVMLG